MCATSLNSSTIATALLRLDMLHNIKTYLAISLENWKDKIIIHNNFGMPSNQCDPLKCISGKLEHHINSREKTFLIKERMLDLVFDKREKTFFKC